MSWSELLLTLSRTVPPRFPRSFGLREVVLQAAHGSVEWVVRHVLLVNRLEELRRDTSARHLRVLDFGGGDGALATVLRGYGLARHYHVVLADTDGGALARAPRDAPITEAVQLAADGALPFDDTSFDACVSSDVFEHIPPPDRARWVAECRRVASRLCIHTVPCDSADGRFRGTETDRALQTWHEQTFGAPERFTAEHQEHGLPTLDELRELFPGAELQGFFHADDWLRGTKEQFVPARLPGRIARGLRFVRGGAARVDEPPFRSCLVIEAVGAGSLPGRTTT